MSIMIKMIQLVRLNYNSTIKSIIISKVINCKTKLAKVAIIKNPQKNNKYLIINTKLQFKNYKRKSKKIKKI